ncbi:hypothetical protein Zmor_019396 [Zophobas morio]|uniref:protein-tyrosine-phosphatase n=1 Tax=Zophobas morio TaxID=2755281 RepID=A0AA38I1K4_9CUCU|nr:hypothetical protein Zmor_019396 [Zophobas morio]
MWYLLFLGSLARAEIITLTTGTNITCVATDNSVKSTVYLNPPINSGFIKHSTEINDWIHDDWETVNSVNMNHNLVIDKRWEGFQMLHEDTGYALDQNSLSFSVCVTGNFFLNVFTSNFLKEGWLKVTPPYINFSTKNNSCRWFHYSLVKHGNTITLISADNVEKLYNVDFDPYWIYVKDPNRNTTFWKLHKYKFKMSTIPTREQEETKLAVNFTDNLCLSMYVSVDTNSYLDIILETNTNVTKKTIIGFNEDNTLKDWQRIQLEAPSFGESNISFSRGLINEKDQKGYWAIDEISFCSKNIEVLTASSQDEAPEDYRCESLEQKEQLAQATNLHMLKCDKPGFLGKDCNIPCDVVLGSSYPHCESHKICQDASSCFCSWGYTGQDCNETCGSGTWGMFCKNKCSEKCGRKCHGSTGKCLSPEDRLGETLPINVTITANKTIIFWPSIDKKLKDVWYDVKFVCASNWCRGQVVENYTMGIPSGNEEVFEFKNFKPLTKYQANVTVYGFNKSLEKQYKMIRADNVYVIRDVSIFSSTFSSLWVRFGVAGMPDKDSSYRLWYQEIDSKSHPNNTENVSRCKLWDGYMCARIDDLKKETLYAVVVERIKTQDHTEALSEISLGFTNVSGTDAPENVKIGWGSDGEAIISWTRPMITDEQTRKFLVEVKSADNVVKHVEVKENQKTGRYKLPVEYNSWYTISVCVLTEYEGEKYTINVTFVPFKFPLSSNRPIIKICGQTCHLLIPKPENQKYQSYSKIVGVPAKNNNTNIMKLLESKSDLGEHGLLRLNITDYDDKYFIAETGTESIFQLNGIKNYTLHFVHENNDDYSIYPRQNLGEKEADGNQTLLSSVPFLTLFVTISTILLALLSLLFLLKNVKKRRTKFDEETKIVGEKLLNPSKQGPQQFTKVDVRLLETYIKQALLTGKDFIAQFRSLPAANRPTVHAFHNKNKNKNNENIPYDHNRVTLAKMEGLGDDDYINASYIDGLDRQQTYIAAQGPKFYTVRDFWRMIWQENVHIVVMATNFMENKKRKSAEYFPQKCGAIFECGTLTIKLTKEEVYEHHTVRILEVCYKRAVRQIQHFHLTWSPDSHRPLYPNCIVPLVKTIRAIRESSDRPILIHCSSGSNRTGTLILCDLALQMAQSSDSVDFYSLLKTIRDQRPNMISSEKQYILAHLVVLECLMEHENVFKKSFRENLHLPVFKEQLNYVARLAWHDDVVEHWASRRSNSSSYTFLNYAVDGYNTSKKFLTARSPSKQLISSFWKMVTQEKIHSIVLLDQEQDKMWPYQNVSNNALWSVKKIDSWKTTYCELTKLSLKVSRLPTNNIIHEQTIYLTEMDNSQHSENTNWFLNIIDDLNKFSDSKPILVMCHDGVRKSGIFVTLDYVIEKCKKEFEVDVCNAIRNVRRSGLPFVQNPNEMEFLYSTALQYLQKFDAYACIL